MPMPKDPERLVPALRTAEARVVELEDKLTNARREVADLQDLVHRLRTRNTELERAMRAVGPVVITRDPC